MPINQPNPLPHAPGSQARPVRHEMDPALDALADAAPLVRKSHALESAHERPAVDAELGRLVLEGAHEVGDGVDGPRVPRGGCAEVEGEEEREVAAAVLGRDVVGAPQRVEGEGVVGADVEGEAVDGGAARGGDVVLPVGEGLV